MRGNEGGQGLAMAVDRLDLRQMRQVDLVAARIEDLRDEAEIGNRRRIAEAEGPALDHRLDRLQTALQNPVAIPSIDLVLRAAERAFEIIEHPQIVERVNVASNRKRHGARFRGEDRI